MSALFQSLNRDAVVAAQIVTTQIQAEDMLKMVAAGFDLPYQRIGKAGLLLSMESYFRGCVKEGKRVLLVVDEAQGLPRKSIEELRMLSNFHLDGRPLVQTFMLGQREFRTTMRSEGFEQLRQRVIAAYHLKPLDETETRGYIEHRLRTAKWDGDPVFTAEALRGIHEFSQGVPRRINTLCDRLMLYGYLEELHEIDQSALSAVASDLIEEQGGTPSPALSSVVGMPSLVAPDSAPASPAVSVPPSTPGDGDRLAAVENSVASLADALKEELSLLRQALLAQDKNGE